MEQETLFTIEAKDHLALIHDKRGRRDQLRAILGSLFEQRQKLALKFNEYDAAFEDAMDGMGLARDDKGRRDEVLDLWTKRQRIRTDMVGILERQKAHKLALVRVNAEFEAAIGGVQTELVVLPDVIEPEPGEIMTNVDLHAKRRQQAADHAVKVLQAFNGRISGVDLASLLGVSSHGLAGLIEWDKRIAKTHGGRLGNTMTFYLLAGE